MLQGTGLPPPTENYQAQDINNTEAEKLWYVNRTSENLKMVKKKRHENPHQREADTATLLISKTILIQKTFLEIKSVTSEE